MLVVGGGLLIIATMMPWLTASTGFGSISVSGLDSNGDGIIVLVAGVVAALVGGAELAAIKVPNGIHGLMLFGGLGALATAFYDHAQIRERIEEVNSDFALAQVGAGIWLLYVGAVVLSVAGGLLVFVDREAQSADLPDGVRNRDLWTTEALKEHEQSQGERTRLASALR